MSFVTRLNQEKEELFSGRKVKLDDYTFHANKEMDEIWMESPYFDDMRWYADISDGEIVRNEFTIYWIHEGEEYEGFALYNESRDGDYITFNTWQGEGKNASTDFDYVDADWLECGENELREIWDDLLSDAETSEDLRLDVTYTELPKKGCSL